MVEKDDHDTTLLSTDDIGSLFNEIIGLALNRIKPSPSCFNRHQLRTSLVKQAILQNSESDTPLFVRLCYQNSHNITFLLLLTPKHHAHHTLLPAIHRLHHGLGNPSKLLVSPLPHFQKRHQTTDAAANYAGKDGNKVSPRDGRRYNVLISTTRTVRSV